MPEKTVKRRVQDPGDKELASDDGPIFSTITNQVTIIFATPNAGATTMADATKPS